MIIRLFGTITLDGCDHFPNQDGIYVHVNLTPPNNLMANQINDDEVNGIDVNTDNLSIQCDYCNVSHDINFQIDGMTYERGDRGVTVSSDVTDEFTDVQAEIFNDVQSDLLHSIKLKVDTHWNCYCKKQKVCGCGCDPLHDGW